MTETLVPVEQKHDVAIFNALVEDSSFKRVQLMGSNSQEVKEGKFTMGHFALIDGQEHEDLGDSIDCIILDWRPKAMKVKVDVVVLYDAESADFKKIVTDSEVQDSGCMYGPEFLIWIPAKGFVPYFLNNKSARYEARALYALIGKAATIKSILVKGQKYSWHAPKVKPCTVPLDSMPLEEDVKSEVDRFRSPEKVQKDYAEAAAKGEERAR